LLRAWRSNNTKYKQYSQSDPWTLAQWNRAKPYQRALYRFAFSPLGFLCVLPVPTFVVLHRIMSKWYELVWQSVYVAVVWYMGGLKFDMLSNVFAMVSGWPCCLPCCESLLLCRGVASLTPCASHSRRHLASSCSTANTRSRSVACGAGNCWLLLRCRGSCAVRGCCVRRGG
jgi:hypothetical protein